MACICHDKASKEGYKYFAIGNYGICYGGKDQVGYENMLKDHSQKASDCLTGNLYEECSDDDMECSGGAKSVFVYSFKSFLPTKPMRKLLLN